MNKLIERIVEETEGIVKSEWSGMEVYLFRYARVEGALCALRRAGIVTAVEAKEFMREYNQKLLEEMHAKTRGKLMQAFNRGESELEKGWYTIRHYSYGVGGETVHVEGIGKVFNYKDQHEFINEWGLGRRLDESPLQGI